MTLLYLAVGLIIAEATLAFSRWNDVPYSRLTYLLALLAWPWPVALALFDMMEKSSGRNTDKR